MERLYCLLIGYLFGLFQTAYIYGRMNGIDIRDHGSGNAGTTNTLRILGKKAGVLVLIGDITKTILAISVARVLFGESRPEMIYLLSLYAAAGAILGHNFPFYLNFKGGKGIAATAGLLLSFHWLFTMIAVPLFFGTFFLTHYVSLGSLLVYAGFLIEIVVLGQSGFFQMTQAHLNEMYLLALFLTVMAYAKHRTNIVRLAKGEERKTYLTKKNS
ncbi:MAG: glycerol-3-phosphate 1-O-acyltransferase PlsY [Lachnospiraceae bacterium]|nr:glycerol-3-phosphate 1-O-acyltransferase PlsY [Lachnospiraceae bacterium]MDD3659191.1 glycerol-3-phosphate 1-O-acyltransferase PlsY [Lachnospiraceae bacterium]